MNAYRSHTCGALTAADAGSQVRLSGWVHRVRDHGGVLFIDLRDHYGMTQVIADSDSPAFAALEKLRAETVIRIDGRVKLRDASLVNPKLPTGEIEVYATARRGAGRVRRTAAAGVRRPGLSRGNAAGLSLHRPAARVAAQQHHAAFARGEVASRRDVGQGIYRVPDPDHHRVVPRRRARLPGAVAPASGQVLCAAAGAAAVQAADHGGGLRPLFPDRAVFPRRRPARRPLAHGLLPARRGNVVRGTGRRLRRRPAGHPGAVRTVRRRPRRQHRLAAHPLCRELAEIRHRQARPAQPDRDAGRQRSFPRLGLRHLRQAAGTGRHRNPRHSRADGRQPQVRRPHERVCAA